MKGILTLYFATGEQMRLQFIGDKSLQDGRVVNYDEIYDIRPGDKIEFLSKFDSKFNTTKVTVNERFLLIYMDIFQRGQSDMEVEYTPDCSTKSWGQQMEDMKNEKT